MKADVAIQHSASRRWYRLHVSTCVAILLASCAVVVVVVPGQVVNCLRVTFDSYGVHTYAHGWPWVFLERSVGYGLDDDQWWIDTESPAWRYARCWQFSPDSTVTSTHFSPVKLALDVLCGAIVIGTAGAIAECCRRRRERVWQFNISDLLACVLLCSAILASWRWQYDRQTEVSRVAHELEKSGAHFVFGYVGPAWLGRLIGTGPLAVFKEPVEAKLFADVNYLTLQLLRHHESLGHLRKVEFSIEADIEEGAIANLAQLATVESLWFFGSRLDDRVLGRISTMPRLRELTLFSCNGMTDASIVQLRANDRLETLNLWLTPSPL